MRVIAGSLKGRRLEAPTWKGLRPTSDKLRETLFNMLGSRIDGARVLDGFAGTGALGVEAVSRGAAAVVFVESDRRAQALIERNLIRCGVTGRCAIIRAVFRRCLDDLRARVDFMPFDVALLDPPYDVSPASVLEGVDQVLRATGVVVLEHARRQKAPEQVGRLIRVRGRESGDSALTFYTTREGVAGSAHDTGTDSSAD